MSTYSLTDFSEFVLMLQRRIQRDYDRSVNKDLSKQFSQDLFKRNVTSVMKQAFVESLSEVNRLEAASVSEVLQKFDGFIDAFMSYALQKHRSSCAMSNFPDEHRPSQSYIADTLADIETDWSAFEQQVNQKLG